jgi:hypothetical protein
MKASGHGGSLGNCCRAVVLLKFTDSVGEFKKEKNGKIYRQK